MTLVSESPLKMQEHAILFFMPDKESACNAGDLGSIPGLGRSPGGGIGNPLQYSWPGESPWTEEPRVGHN